MGTIAKLEFHEIQQAIRPMRVSGKPLAGPLSFSTDTRTISRGDVYVPLAGERFDGHDFIEHAIESGACAVIACDTIAIADKLTDQVPFLFVKDTLAAYHAIASRWRLRVDPLVVCVTGSSGKTTTKEMCASVFSTARRVHKSSANENNEFGVPKTILSMPEETEVLVLELAMRGLGQIDLLAATAEPDIGIITCAGAAHIELLGSVENIARAKCELFAHLAEGKTGIVGQPSELLVSEARKVFSGRILEFQESHIIESEVSAKGTRFAVEGVADELFVAAHGLYNLQDAWCAIMAAHTAGLSAPEIKDGLASYSQVVGRGNTLVTRSGSLLINESYNANPDSVKCALTGMLDERAFPHKKKIVVLGEMAELGEQTEYLHRELGFWIKELPVTMLITVGEVASQIASTAEGGAIDVRKCSDIAQAVDTLTSTMDRDTCVMIKGSNCARLSTLVDQLVASS